jgi:outer membrane murein-binding lipoprotein Lpp
MTDHYTRRETLAVTGSTLLLAGCTSESSSEKVEQSPSEIVNAWLNEHESTEQDAVEQYSAGNEALEAGDYSRAIVRFERATNKYESLEKAVGDETRNHENGSEVWEILSILDQYYTFMRRAATWRYSAAYERSVNDDPAASTEALGTSNARFERAEELKEEFQVMLDE